MSEAALFVDGSLASDAKWTAKLATARATAHLSRNIGRFTVALDLLVGSVPMYVRAGRARKTGQEGVTNRSTYQREQVSALNRLIQLALLLAGAAIAVAAVVQLRGKRETAEMTAQSIEDQLDALDPVTRGAVVARLTKDAATEVQAQRDRR